MRIISKANQGQGAFNGGEIIENKPIGFPQDGGEVKPYSNLFYWANAIALKESTIGLHPHQGFEIMSVVLEGTIKHYDSQMDDWVELKKGDIQIIRAGKGISHAEHMTEGSRMFQIWVDPDLNKTMQQPASYSDYRSSEFKPIVNEGHTVTRIIGEGSHFALDASGLQMQQIEVQVAYSLHIPDGKQGSIYMLDGNLAIDGTELAIDDFIILDPGNYHINGIGLLFEMLCDQRPDYETYVEMMARRS